MLNTIYLSKLFQKNRFLLIAVKTKSRIEINYEL